MARILVVDDAAFMRKMVSDALTKGGHEVVGEAGNGAEAIERFQELKPELTTLDITMQLGTQAETITVGAEAPLLEAEKADRGGVVATRNLAELPIITRTPILLAT